jgi:hypothetical protein
MNKNTYIIIEDGRRLIMPEGLSDAQVQEIAETLTNMDVIQSYKITQESK